MVEIAVTFNVGYLKLERGKVIKTKFYYVLDALCAAPNSINYATALCKVIMVIM